MRTWATVCLLIAGLAGAETPLRREAEPRFAIDTTFQDKGGVQYFYTLVEPEAAAKDVTFQLFRPFDVPDVWAKLEAPTHVVLSRLVYTVEKDVSFFNEARVRDTRYINAVAKGMNVTRREDGSFQVAAMPANSFTIEYFDAAKLGQASGLMPAVQRVLELTGVAESPVAIVFQHNRDFARVFGMRTAAAGFTWTAHYPVGPGRTRLVVFTMSYLHTLPPFFLGGAKRVFRESTDGARVLIDALRAYQPPPT
ncbi:MAG: hypothetical protein JNJ54_16970 [Myxococcaceae bacterium]|nr:hypothetical protein [Myxococcaceae bacterium]